MSRERWIFVAILGALGLLVLALWLAPKLAEVRAPRPVGAWVAVEEVGSGIARVGRVELAVGTPFRLHAILEARNHRGESLYYTEAPAVELHGNEIPAESLRRWPEHRRARVLWFTVESPGPYLAVTDEADLRRFEMGELFRATWPQAWAIPGLVEPAHDDSQRRGMDRQHRGFGIQRYHVRIELFAGELDLVPTQRLRSWGAGELTEQRDGLPTVVVMLPGPLEEVSRIFGLTQVDPQAPLAPELEAEIEGLEEQELVFRRDRLKRRHLEASGTSFEGLIWREGFLGDGQGPAWQEEVRPGDLVQVGERTVILYRDEEASGILDETDLALDFSRGAVVAPLGRLFVTPTVIRWAAVSPRAGAGSSAAEPEPEGR